MCILHRVVVCTLQVKHWMDFDQISSENYVTGTQTNVTFSNLLRSVMTNRHTNQYRTVHMQPWAAMAQSV